MLKRLFALNHRQINGLLLVDNDGTFIEGTETRNRIALQDIVDSVCNKADILIFEIPWDLCNGRAESDIHAILVENCCHNFGGLISAEEFTRRAKQGYLDNHPDYTPREHMIDALMGLQDQGIFSVLVSNSERPAIDKCMREAFKDTVHSATDVFPIIITKTEVLAAGKNTKPSADPFHMAHAQAEELFKVKIPKNKIQIIEDSGTGVDAGIAFHGDGDLTHQFVTMATPHPGAGSHVTDMTGCLKAINSNINTPQAPHVMETLARHP